MDFLNEWWGVNDHIGIGEISARTVVMFLFVLLLIRIFGMRPFGKGDVFDTAVTILLGAVAARAIVGATPFFPTMASCIIMIVIHKILSKLSYYSRYLGKKIKGETVLLYAEGRFLKDNMKAADITEHDIFEEMRLTVQLNSLENIKEIYYERTGKISFVKSGN